MNTETRRIRSMRDGTLRAQVRDALKHGTTFEQVERIVKDFDRKRRKKAVNVTARAKGAIYLLQHHIGYGVRKQANGKLKLVEKPRTH